MALWLVRAGKHGERESEALDMGIATVGWNKIGDLAAYQSRDAIAGALRTVYPNAPEARTQNHARQLWSFGHVIAPGDRVVLPLKKQAAVAWGAVASAYEYRPANPDELRHTHRVVWSDHLVARGRFSPDLLYSFGASLTVCRITRNDAERRVQRYFVDDPDARPGPSQPCAPRDACDDSESDSDTAEASRLNLEAVGRDLIAQRLEREFKGHGLARLVGAILEAHGQRLRVSPPGADGGVDLLAGSGPLGLDYSAIARTRSTAPGTSSTLMETLPLWMTRRSTAWVTSGARGGSLGANSTAAAGGSAKPSSGKASSAKAPSSKSA